MIGDAIKRQGEKGSGGGADAFKPGVAYVCGKAARVELRNLASTDWRHAALVRTEQPGSATVLPSCPELA
jgi:hypothetical protein